MTNIEGETPNLDILVNRGDMQMIETKILGIWTVEETEPLKIQTM